MRAILAVMIIAMLAEPALAQTVTSMDTELAKGRCRFIETDGEVGDYALKRCPGLAGARVFTDAMGAHNVSLSFQWGKAKALDVVKSYSIGTKLEWRGFRGKQGFKPYAAIVTVIVWDRETEKTYNVLGVLRMEARNACLMAVVDETASPDALALARARADAEAPTFVCATDKPKTLGKTSQWAQQVIGLEGNPPK